MDFVALESIRELQKNDHANEYFIFVTPSEDRCLEESENVHIIELKLPTLECKRILDVLHLPEEQLVAVYNASINTTW